MRNALATRSRRRFAAAGALIVTASVLATVLSGVLPQDGNRSSRAATNATATTEIRRQDLVEVETDQGTQGYGDEREVVNRLSGTVTWLPDQGSVIAPDRVLYRVDGEPVVLLDGRVPAYRDLGPAVGDGSDVAQLERNLRTLGYDASGYIDLDDSWDAGTTAAVERWQAAHSLDETGVIKLGTVVFQPGRRRVASLAATLGGSAAGGGPPGGGPAGAGEVGTSVQGVGQTSFASYPIPSNSQDIRAEEAADPDRKQENDRSPAGEEPGVVEPEKQPREREEPQDRRVPEGQPAPPVQAPPSYGAAPGLPGVPPVMPDGAGGTSSVGPSEAPAASNVIMVTTSTRPVVTVDLDTSKITLATRKTRVVVELPSGDDVRGRIIAVDSEATASEAEQGGEQAAITDATVEVTIRLGRSKSFLDQAPVVVNLERSRRRDVLAVPVTALLARDRGEFAVEVREGTGRRLVPVEPGLFAGGFVEVSGRGLRPGMAVTDARI